MTAGVIVAIEMYNVKISFLLQWNLIPHKEHSSYNNKNKHFLLFLKELLLKSQKFPGLKFIHTDFFTHITKPFSRN